MTRRDDILRALAASRDRLAPFHVRSLSVFGSVARDEATEESDVDILVEFEEPVGIFEFVRLRRLLEEVVGRRVDLATPQALKDRIRQRVLAEAVRAA